METNSMMYYLSTQAVAFGLRVLGAIVIWILGTWLIRFGTNVLRRTLTAKPLDTTLVSLSLFGPVQDHLHNFTNVCTFAFRRAWA